MSNKYAVFQQVYECEKLFRVILNWIAKYVHLQCGIEYNKASLYNGYFSKILPYI